MRRKEMKNKIVGILICTLVIASSTVASVRSIGNQITISSEIEDIDIYNLENNKELDISISDSPSLNSSFEQCIAACLGIPLAGNCIYFIIGCAVAFGPYNPCCWAAPIFCGVNIGLLISCIGKCSDQFGDNLEKLPCLPPYIVRLICFIQINNRTGASIILGLLCLFQRLQKIIDWLKEEGYLNIELPMTSDCNCDN
jgi:hypothetical protein